MKIEEVNYEDFFKKSDLIPAIIQNEETGKVLMLAYMNRESMKATLETKVCTFWSRSRRKLWIKGETSKNFMHVKKFYYDCDEDTLLIKVKPDGPACHTGNESCFYREIEI